MRPLKLIMRAFGPYVKEQSLDFTELQNRKFFLIHGPTGAGKTSILDAICFALYGDTSGAEREGKQMRSDYADPQVETEVIYDFAIGTTIYRVTRNPEQQKPKKSGDGFTVKKANAVLHKMTSAGEEEQLEMLAHGWSSVTSHIEGLLGFKSSQFRQVVMLPQGEFKKLLTADSKERQAIMEVLFGTYFFRSIEELLKQKAKSLEDEISNLRKEMDWVIKESGATSLEELLEKNNQDLDSQKQYQLKEQAAKDAAKKAQTALDHARANNQKVLEKAAAQLALEQLIGLEKEMSNNRHSLSRAQKAASLRDVEAGYKKNQAELIEAQRLCESNVQGYALAQEEQKKARVKLSEERERDALREKTAQDILILEGLKDQVKRLGELRTELASTEQLLANEKEQVESLKGLLHSSRDLASRYERELLENTKVAGEKMVYLTALESKRTGAAQLKSYLEIKAQLVQLTSQATTIKEQAEHEQNALKVAKEELKNAQDIFLTGQAALMAASLTIGAPCPVCGSTDHPAPAASSQVIPDEIQIQELENQVALLEGKYSKAVDKQSKKEREIDSLASKLEHLEQLLGHYGSMSLTELEREITDIEAKLELTQKAEKQLAELDTKINGAKEEIDKYGNQIEEKESSLKDLEKKYTAISSLALDLEKSIPEELQREDSLLQALEDAKGLAQQLKVALEQAISGHSMAEESVAKYQALAEMSSTNYLKAQEKAQLEYGIFMDRLQEAHFATIDDYEKALKSNQEVESLITLLTQYDQDLYAARERVNRADLAAKDLELVELDTLEQQLREAESNRDSIFEEGIRLGQRLEQQRSWLKNIQDIKSKLEGLDRKYAVMGQLANISNGKNQLGLSLQRFVLGALLDDVTVAATERLKKMTGGRYQLQRTMDRDNKRAAAGLALEVCDNYTGVNRSVFTLSGGETFLASLSLALGLTDVVQAYSGGIHLDAIFVDEGFGTLDPETLDMAIQVLFDLQQGGRLVGIISHVPELKERIDARLEVITTDRGSRARFVLA